MRWGLWICRFRLDNLRDLKCIPALQVLKRLLCLLMFRGMLWKRKRKKKELPTRLVGFNFFCLKMAWIVFYPGGRRICHCSLTLAGRGEVSIRGGFLGFQLCPVFLWLTWTLRHPVGSRDIVKELRVDRNGQSWIIRNSRVQDNGMTWGRWEMDDATRVIRGLEFLVGNRTPG